MEIIDSIKLIFVVISTGGSLALAFLVLKDQPNIAVNKIFGLLSFLSAAWLLANFISVHPTFVLNSLWWIRLSIFFAAPLNTLFYLFARSIAEPKFPVKTSQLVLISAATLGIMALTLTPWTFSGVEIVNNSPQPVAASGLIVFGLSAVFFNILAVFELIKKYRGTSGVQRRQISLVLTGVFALFGLVIATIFIPAVFFKVNTFVSLLPLYVLIFLSVAAYAIVKHHLFNAKVVATEALIVVIWTVLLSKVFVGASLGERVIDFLIFLTTMILGILLRNSVIQEVKQREKLEILSKELAAANMELRKLDQAKSEFISIASHQLRAPLTVIKGYVSLLIEGTLGKITEEGKEAMTKVAVSAEQLVKLVGDLLNLSRIEAGKIQYDKKAIDISSIVDGVLGEFKQNAERKKIDLILEKPQKLQPIFGDPDKLREVIINLIDNAIKYSAVASKIIVNLETRGDKILFSLKDSGMGISPADASRLFVKFARTEEARKVDPNGMGIGLYFVKRIVDDHGGKVWVESGGLGRGSTFFVELPIKS